MLCLSAFESHLHQKVLKKNVLLFVSPIKKVLHIHCYEQNEIKKLKPSEIWMLFAGVFLQSTPLYQVNK